MKFVSIMNIVTNATSIQYSSLSIAFHYFIPIYLPLSVAECTHLRNHTPLFRDRFSGKYSSSMLRHLLKLFHLLFGPLYPQNIFLFT